MSSSRSEGAFPETIMSNVDVNNKIIDLENKVTALENASKAK